MPSLKEVKTRIASVNNTRKITSAMKMVASSKLHKAQQSIENMRPYESRMSRMMTAFVGSMEGELHTPYAQQRSVKRVAIVVYTSNSSLCGGFNANAIRALRTKVEQYQSEGIEVARVIALGKKGGDAARKLGFADSDGHGALLDHPTFQPVADIAEELMKQFVDGEIDQVDIIYHHFKSSASQVLTQETFLPLQLPKATAQAGTSNDYIVEPSRDAVVEKLIPGVLRLQLYTALLDSLASEHAARVIAMQIATDNADELLQELTLTYNKTRQQAITTELLDIVGGSMQ
ncbi:MAG: F0F1 ATP synthase subunit gamma [Bacteroidaceae bacterium]|nr:F0F1 ATP synthase subunit gamma [Bacteroidaceae bacterium]